MIKKLLLFVVLFVFHALQSQTLYWVGGSGNMNDGHHWSYTSGGKPCNLAPNLNADLIVDDSSSTNSSFVINIVGLNYAKSLHCNLTNAELHFTGDHFSNFTCSGDFVLNDYTFFESTTKLIFSNDTEPTGTINFWKNVIKSDVLFESGNWTLQTFKLSDQSTLKFIKGNYTINNCFLVTGNLEANTEQVVFNTQQSQFHVKNKLTLGSNVSFNSNDFILIAQKNNAFLYNVNPSVAFGNNYKIILPSPLACVVTTSSTNASCFGSCDATFSVNFAGCITGPYDLLFTTAAPCIPSGTNSISPPTLTFTGLCDNCAGYLVDVIVFDPLGNFVTSASGNTHAVRTRAGITFNNIKQPNCFGQCNGSLRFIVSSGQQPYTVYANPPTGTTFTNVIAFSTSTVTGLCAGVQTFSVVDNAGCVTISTVSIAQPSVLLANGSSSSVTCNSACSGSALTSPTGGTSPYTYSWTTSATTSSVSGLCAGNVSVTVTDTKSCTATYSVNIAQPPALTLTVNKANLACGAVCDGSAAITPSGGTAPYTYSWSPITCAASSTTGLCAGIYTVIVTDVLNCTKSTTFQITAPPTLTATPTQTNITCNTFCNGSINLNPSGGNPGYTYVWSPSVSSASVASGLCVGVYSYTVTDIQLCTYANTVSIIQPPATTLSISKTDVTCFGACNGIATASLTGGTSPYTYTWSPGAPTGQGTNTITGLCPATYSLNTRDANSCVTASVITITQPTVIAVNASTIAPTCNGVCNGTISAAPTGGTPPYTYTLQPSAGAPITTGIPFTGLCAGSYTLQVGDANGCIRSQTLNLTQPNALTYSLSATAINCFNQCSSTISSIVGGGTPAYTYSWSNGSLSSSIVNQCTGVYTSTVTDGNGCKTTASVNVTSPTDMTVSITPTNPNCDAQCTGVATATITGGTANYTTSWNTGASGTIASALCQGTYTATVTDSKGCVKTQTVSIVTPPALSLTATNGTATCAGVCDGTVSVSPSGGTAAYFYSWNSTPAQTTATATSLCAGNYVATITDSKGCIASIAASVSQPSVLTTAISNILPSCNICIGAATASGVGGNAPYTYSWSPGGQTISNPTDLCIGTQTVVTTDSRGCTSTSTVLINQTVILLLTSNGSTLACNGACTGIATANASGGLAPYSYTWSPAPIQNTQTATGLCAGMQSVTVADANGCSNTSTLTFVSPPAITLTITKTDVTCNGSCNGTATATASGGTGAITYLWQPGGLTTSSISGLCPGDYTVTATDINSCSQTQVVTITQSSSLTATFTNNNPTGCSTTDGSISFVPTGGAAPYSFTWTPGPSTNPLINLTDGIYVLNLIDLNGCSTSFTTTLSDPFSPTVTPTTNSVSCFGQCTGSASISIVGNGPFSVNWPSIPSTNTIVPNLCAGSYVAQVTDNNGCVANQSVTITQPTQISSTGISTNVVCNAICSASINITPSGGLPPYTYSWTPAGGNIEDPVSLCAGNYSVDIQDLNNCTVTNTFVITQPSSLTVTFNKKDVLCNGGCTGSVRAVVSGGTSPYTYTWTPLGLFVGSNMDTIVNLCTGVYSVNATDFNGCSISGTITIGEPTVLTSTITSINAKCNAQCNASATITPTGGTAPYTYLYNTTPAIATQTISSLCVGTYTGTVTDANGCISSHGFTISQPAPISVTTTPSNPKCNAVCDGSVATSVSGGNPNYNYNWIPSGGPVQNPTGLCSGNYTVVVTDDSLCTGQALVTLTDPTSLVANISFTNPTCSGGCTGIVTANPTGGTTPYVYSWASPVINNQTVANLCAGVYTLTLTDANLCQDIQTVTLSAPSLIAVNPAVSPASCGASNGSINAVAINGNAPYSFNWLPPVPGAQSTNTMVTGLAAGVYTVIVTDASLCTATISIPLSNSNGPTGATITSTDVACNGQCNGAADISNPVGGTAPYVISWISPVSSNSVITNLCAGSYTAQIADSLNCLFFQTVVINEPQLIDDNEIINSAACFGNCNGSIFLGPTGGNGGYTYLWSDATTASSVTSLCPGVYSVTITDNKNCTLTANYNIPSVTTITSSTFATNNLCFGDCNGTLLATNVAGGVPPYSFAWSDPLGQSTAMAVGLCNSNYSVTIVDANGCFAVVLGSVTSPSQVTFTPTITQPGCGLCDGGAIVNPTGGTPTYSITWSDSQTGTTASNLCAGVYAVQITDGGGCVSSTNVIINSSSSITGETITQADESCGSACDGTVSVTATGGVAPITYNWLHNGSSSQTLVGLCAGTYFCNMTDNNGCTRTASVVINSATTLSISSQVSQSSCSSNTGSITVNVTGGTGVYTYTWLPSGNTATVTNLAPGSYTLTVTDGNGCSQSQIYSVNSVNAASITYTQQNITCSTVCDGDIALSITGGLAPYSILWSNSAITQTVSNLCTGNYSVAVTDANGCIAVQNFSLTNLSPIVFSAANLTSPLCNNNCNGSITTLPSGGVLPYTYSWIVSTSTTSIANSLCTGMYSVVVTDANGCPAQDTYTLTGPSTISLTAVVTDATCNGFTDGAIDITVVGGTPAYNYTWTPTGSVFTEDLVNVAANTYSVHLTDGNGCVLDSSFIIAEPTAIDDNEILASSACFGNCNGSIELNPTGGNGGYTYSWTPSASTGTITSLCPGPYTATITDSQGCTFTANYNLPSLTTITSTTLGTNNICFNDCNGILTATNIAGGLAPYTIQWNDPLGQSGNTAINLCTGNYSVTITDANGCFNQIPADVSSTSQVTFTPSITNPSCGLCDGSATVTPVGGTTPYTYLWSNNQAVNTATSLCSGIYVVQITDGNGCVNSTNVVINNSSSITGETIISTDVTCSSSCDGTASVTAVGGNGAISYNWVHDNSTSQSITNLCPGTYFCNMTDATGCSRTASVVIGSITTLTISSQVTQSSCTSNTGSITVNVTGGTGVYTYTWLPSGNTATVTNLAPGSYTLTVTDGNGCSQSQIYSVNSVNAASITYTQQNISCTTMCDGSIDLSITGGVAPYTILWSNSAITQTISNLCVGVYSVSVTDVSGCVAVQNFSLSSLPSIVFSAPNLTNPKCYNDCNGSLVTIPNGGTLPYTYSWSPSGALTPSVGSLCSGNYSITLTDANGCTASQSYTLVNPLAISLTSTVTNATCNTAPDGAIDITVGGGTPAYTYTWTNAAATEDITNVLSGTYSFTVTDQRGCTKDTTFIIASTLTVNAIAGRDTLFCQNGMFSLDGSTSNGGITYQWIELPSNTVISNTLVVTINPATGTNTYVLVATNGLCIDRDTIRVQSNPLPVVDAGSFVSTTATIPVQIGGNPTCSTGSLFTWLPNTSLDNPFGTNPTASNTITTIFTVTVVDANGCSNSDTVTVFIYPEIKIPTGFSPNGDGKNDTWQIDLLHLFPDIEVEIYNRWGEQLFYSKGYSIPWNGQYKGKDLPVGTYYYIINLNHPAYPNVYTSPLTIFR